VAKPFKLHALVRAAMTAKSTSITALAERDI